MIGVVSDRTRCLCPKETRAPRRIATFSVEDERDRARKSTSRRHKWLSRYCGDLATLALSRALRGARSRELDGARHKNVNEKANELNKADVALAQNHLIW